ncbi:MAG: DJ-1/PfpI family protein [Pleurocapsa sp. SU_5_0]|nr:DJ-1/PfpI family protein [Pleurocapsa sp. SU_5_0]
MNFLNIGFLVYPDVIQLDVMGVFQVLSFPPNVKTHLIAKSLNPIVSNEGLQITPTTTLDNCPPLDVICVPGGGIGQVEVMKDRDILNFLKQQSNNARYTTSVCTGSLILAAANLLQGYKATCHWAFCKQLALFGVKVVSERVVIDRDRITGAGVTSGIDFGLTLLSLLWGEEMAKMAQLMMEYDPQPPFQAGTPKTAEKEIVNSLLQLGNPLIEAFLRQTQEIISK